MQSESVVVERGAQIIRCTATLAYAAAAAAPDSAAGAPATAKNKKGALGALLPRIFGSGLGLKHAIARRRIASVRDGGL